MILRNRLDAVDFIHLRDKCRSLANRVENVMLHKLRGMPRIFEGLKNVSALVVSCRRKQLETTYI